MVDHPLAMDVEAMRRTGYAAVDALVALLADPGADPVLRRASPEEMRSRLGGPPPEQGAGLDAVLARVIEDVLPYAHFGELAARDGEAATATRVSPPCGALNRAGSSGSATPTSSGSSPPSRPSGPG